MPVCRIISYCGIFISQHCNRGVFFTAAIDTINVEGKIDHVSLTSQHAFHIDWEDIFTAHELIQAGCMALWERWDIVDRRGHKNRRHGS